MVADEEPFAHYIAEYGRQPGTFAVSPTLRQKSYEEVVGMELMERDGIRISKMTLGTVQLGMNYGIANRSGMPDESGARLILAEAERGGIVSFDTAQDYGRSEAVLGRCLAGRSGLAIISKFTLKADGPLSRAELERMVAEKAEASLRRLGVSKIPILMLHHAGDLLKFGEPLVEACRNLVRSGYAAKMGVSFGADPPHTANAIWACARDDLFEAVQVPVNVLDHRLLRSGLLEEMGKAGKIVFARSVFLQGLLFLAEEELPEKLKPAAEWIGRVRRAATREGMSPAELAVAFVRDLPQVHSLVIGAETAEQVRANIALLNAPPLTERTRAELASAMSDVPEIIISPHLWHR